MSEVCGGSLHRLKDQTLSSLTREAHVHTGGTKEEICQPQGSGRGRRVGGREQKRHMIRSNEIEAGRKRNEGAGKREGRDHKKCNAYRGWLREERDGRGERAGQDKGAEILTEGWRQRREERERGGKRGREARERKTIFG